MKWLLSLILVSWSFLLCGHFISCQAAEGDLLWDHRFGGNGWDEFRDVVQTPDGGYALVGMTQSFGAGLQDFWLVKTDASGDPLWSRTYGGSGNESAEALILTDDGGLLLVGQTTSYGGGYYDIWAVKTDAGGDTLWTRAYGGPYGGSGEDYGKGVVQTDDGGFALVGSAIWGSGEVFLVRTDGDGNELWRRYYGGYYDEAGHSIVRTTDGGYLLVGLTDSFGAGAADAWMIKVDAEGDSLWSKTFGGADYDWGFWGAETDGGYLLVGATLTFGADPPDAWMAKADPEGDSLWAYAYGSEAIEYAYSAIQTDDAILLTGLYNETYLPGQVYLAKTDLNGSVLWTANYGSSLLDDLGFSIIQNNEGDYIIAGRSSTPSGDYEAYLLALEGSGTGILSFLKTMPGDFSLYPPHPNPFNAETAINYTLQASSYASLKLYDTTGRLVETLVEGWSSAGRHKLVFEAKHLASGIYFMKLQVGDFAQMQKLILLK